MVTTLTPIEQYGDIWLKRDDLYEVAGVRGGKVRTCYTLAQGAAGLVTAGSRESPQCNIVASIAQYLGVPCQVHTPSGKLGPEVALAKKKGAEVVQHLPGYNSVIVSRAKRAAIDLGWKEIPFGMECREATIATSQQVDQIPIGVNRIVIPVGSGMSLSGVLHGLKNAGLSIPVLGVVVGANPEKRLDLYAPKDWRHMVTLVNAGCDYHERVDASLGDVTLDPIYEAKCYRFLRDRDLFWIVGARESMAKMNNGKSPARNNGQDLMRGEVVVGQRKTEPGLTWVGGGREYDDLDDTSRKILSASQSGTSIFDPVLCEISYRWFCPSGGMVLDPFAGGSVRGVVASKLGYPYTGIELRSEQVEANRAQGGDICANEKHKPVWIQGDSQSLAKLVGDDFRSDLVFSCPPYADLEVYSDDPRDISSMPYADFFAAYQNIIAQACSTLNDDRFAVWVVGDVRDKLGFYRNLPGDTIKTFLDCGLGLYNEAALVTAVGSLPLRVGKQFSSGRKLGKTHQNVFCFYKGNPKNIKDIFGVVDIDEGLFSSTTSPIFA